MSYALEHKHHCQKMAKKKDIRCSSTVTAKQQQQTRQEPFGSSGEKAAAVAAVVVLQEILLLQEIPAAELLNVVVKVTLPKAIGW
ncbi:unnamed protein product [Sphagnum balticum]